MQKIQGHFLLSVIFEMPVLNKPNRFHTIPLQEKSCTASSLHRNKQTLRESNTNHNKKPTLWLWGKTEDGENPTIQHNHWQYFTENNNKWKRKKEQQQYFSSVNLKKEKQYSFPQWAIHWKDKSLCSKTKGFIHNACTPSSTTSFLPLSQRHDQLFS